MEHSHKICVFRFIWPQHAQHVLTDLVEPDFQGFLSETCRQELLSFGNVTPIRDFLGSLNFFMLITEAEATEVFLHLFVKYGPKLAAAGDGFSETDSQID